MITDNIELLAVHQSSRNNIFGHHKSIEPFSHQRIKDLADLSLAIKQDLSHYPDALALAFFLRSSNLKKYKEQFTQLQNQHRNCFLRSVGTVFHITPANVDTLFVYSFALSYLCGNNNIIRLSQQRTSLTNDLLTLIQDFMKTHTDFASSTQFISYAHSEEITTYFSQKCDFRVIWGGDNTINTVRKSQLYPHSGERVFSSKYSYSIINGAKYGKLSKAAKLQLAKSIYNDIFPFDQAACSSPQVIFWLNTALVTQFNEQLDLVCSQQGYLPDASHVSAQFNLVCEQAVKSDVAYKKMEHFVSVQISSSKNLNRTICGGGFIYHVLLSSIDELITFSQDTDQTLTYWGLSEQQKQKLAVQLEGIDRIVPIGQALSFDTPWDGYDLIRDFTRLVTLI